MTRLWLPCLFVALSIAAFAIGKALNRRFLDPAANATLIAILIVIAVLLISRQNYTAYLQGGGIIGWLLGPATIALGIPLARHRKAISHDAMAIGVATFAGAIVSAIVAPLLIHALGGSSLLALSIA